MSPITPSSEGGGGPLTDKDRADQEFFESLPTRRASASVLLFDDRDHVLLVEPTYRDDWILPGGTVDAGESPWAAAVRELDEELGLTISAAELELAAISHSPQLGVVTESLNFVFRGPHLSSWHIRQFAIPVGEISDWQFLDYDTALRRAAVPLRPRLAAAWGHRPGGQVTLLG